MEKRTVFPALSSSEIYSTWRHTLERKDLGSSRHFLLALIANLLVYLGLAALYRRFHGDPYLAVFIIVAVLLVNYLGYYMVEAYKYARRDLLSANCDESHAESLLFVSYVVFRLYFVALTAFFILMMVASAIPKF